MYPESQYFQRTRSYTGPVASPTHRHAETGKRDHEPAEAELLPDDANEPTVEGAFATDGVDLTVIRWMLEKSPEERLEAAQQLIDAAWALRRDSA